MQNIDSYLMITDNQGNIIPNLFLVLKSPSGDFDCTYLNGRYNYSAPSGNYDVWNESAGVNIITDFFVYPQLIAKEWWVASKQLTDGNTYDFDTLQDVYGEYLPTTITNPKIGIYNNIGTRSVSFESITNTSFKIKLGDSGTPVTTTADLHIAALNV